MDAMHAIDTQGIRAAFAHKANELEIDRSKIQGNITQIEHQMNGLIRIHMEGSDAKWRALA